MMEIIHFHHYCSLPNPTPKALISKNISIFRLWTPNVLHEVDKTCVGGGTKCEMLYVLII